MGKHPHVIKRYQNYNDRTSCTIHYQGTVHATPSDIHPDLMHRIRTEIKRYTLYEHHSSHAVTNTAFGHYIGKEYTYRFYPANTPVTHTVRVPVLGNIELMLAKKHQKVPDHTISDQLFDRDYRGRFFDTTYQKCEWAEVHVTETAKNRSEITLAFIQDFGFSAHQGVREIESVATELFETYRPSVTTRLKDFVRYQIF